MSNRPSAVHTVRLYGNILPLIVHIDEGAIDRAFPLYLPAALRLRVADVPLAAIHERAREERDDGHRLAARCTQPEKATREILLGEEYRGKWLARHERVYDAFFGPRSYQGDGLPVAEEICEGGCRGADHRGCSYKAFLDVNRIAVKVARRIVAARHERAA